MLNALKFISFKAFMVFLSCLGCTNSIESVNNLNILELTEIAKVVYFIPSFFGSTLSNAVFTFIYIFTYTFFLCIQKFHENCRYVMFFSYVSVGLKDF